MLLMLMTNTYTEINIVLQMGDNSIQQIHEDFLFFLKTMYLFYRKWYLYFS